MASARVKKIRFTKHAKEKFELLRKYGFRLAESTVKETVSSPSRVGRRNGQLLALKPFNQEYAIRVVYKLVNDNIVVVTFYPVKRGRFNV